MIGNRGQTGPNVLPGRLKVVTIGPRVTVAFAGDADPAGVAIQAARRALRDDGLLAAIEGLKRESSNGQTDFLVASHNPSTSLIRLRKGIVLDINDICALGNDEPFRDLINQALADNQPLSKSNLRYRFIDRLVKGKYVQHGVGGFPIAVEATPTKHRYLGSNGSYTYKFPQLRWGEETYQSDEEVYTGEGHFIFSVLPSEAVDTPCVGACLLQARLGYVFSPMGQPEAFEISLGTPDSLWLGKEQQMYNVLKHALASHVAAVNHSEGRAS
jgi:hypothetical protein